MWGESLNMTPVALTALLQQQPPELIDTNHSTTAKRRKSAKNSTTSSVRYDLHVFILIKLENKYFLCKLPSEFDVLGCGCRVSALLPRNGTRRKWGQRRCGGRQWKRGWWRHWLGELLWTARYSQLHCWWFYISKHHFPASNLTLNSFIVHL